MDGAMNNPVPNGLDSVYYSTAETERRASLASLFLSYTHTHTHIVTWSAPACACSADSIAAAAKRQQRKANRKPKLQRFSHLHACIRCDFSVVSCRSINDLHLHTLCRSNAALMLDCASVIRLVIRSSPQSRGRLEASGQDGAFSYALVCSVACVRHLLTNPSSSTWSPSIHERVECSCCDVIALVLDLDLDLASLCPTCKTCCRFWLATATKQVRCGAVRSDGPLFERTARARSRALAHSLMRDRSLQQEGTAAQRLNELHRSSAHALARYSHSRTCATGRDTTVTASQHGHCAPARHWLRAVDDAAADDVVRTPQRERQLSDRVRGVA